VKVDLKMTLKMRAEIKFKIISDAPLKTQQFLCETSFIKINFYKVIKSETLK